MSKMEEIVLYDVKDVKEWREILNEMKEVEKFSVLNNSDRKQVEYRINVTLK